MAVPVVQSFKNRALRGSIWTIVGHACNQGLRLGSNLVLTRLLFPEAFGLMALVGVLIQGIQLLSDFGIRGSIIQNKDGDDPAFFNTAWTVQIIRGIALWLLTCLITWPIAIFYEDRRLLWMVPIVGLTGLASGFASTALFAAIRNLRIGRLVLLDMIAQIVAVAVMILWAYLSPSVWALVGGGLIRVILRMIMSHYLIPGYSNKLCWDRNAVREIIRFGRWILVATALGFLFTHGDRVVLAKFLTLSQLGTYAIAFLLSQAVVDVVSELIIRVVFPVYAELLKQGTEHLRRRTVHVRLAVMAIGLPPLWFLAIGGHKVIETLYDQRYASAGWMLQVLAAGAIGTVIAGSAERVLLASGDSFRHMVVQSMKAVLLTAAMAGGAIMAGTEGLIVGIGISRLVSYPVIAWAIRPYGVWLPYLDAAAFGISAVVIGLGLWLV